MGFRKSIVRFDKIFVSTMGILLGLIGLVFAYQAVKISSDIRSRAAPAPTVIKQWEFNGKDSEGWSAVSPNRGTVKNGSFIVTMVKGTTLPVFRNTKVATTLPKGLKTVSISMAVGARQPASPVGSGVVEGATDETDDAEFLQAVKEKVACTQEAKLCPDGSLVGRVPPKCEFQACSEQRKRKFTGQLYVLFTNKRKFEKPITFSGFADGKLQTYALRLPQIDEVGVARIRVVFTSGVKAGESVAVDWIRLLGPVVTPTPTPTPSIVCKTGLGSFSVNTECPGGFRYMKFSCYDGYGRTEGGPTSCKPSETWRSYAEEYCKGHSNCPTTPQPSKTPQPGTPTPMPNCYLQCDTLGNCQTICHVQVVTATPTPTLYFKPL